MMQCIMLESIIIIVDLYPTKVGNYYWDGTNYSLIENIILMTTCDAHIKYSINWMEWKCLFML